MVVESRHLHLGTLTQPPHRASGGCVQSRTDTSICLDGCWRVRGEDLQNRSWHVVLTHGFESIIAIPMYFRITGVAFCHLLSSLGPCQDWAVFSILMPQAWHGTWHRAWHRAGSLCILGG